MNNFELNQIIANLAELKGQPLRDYRKLTLSALSPYEIAAVNQAVRLRRSESDRNQRIVRLSWD